MKKYNKILAVILCVLLVGIGFGAGFLTNSLINRDYEELNWVLEQIDENYLVYDEETGEVRSLSETEYIKILISGLKAEGFLDKYSNYYDKQGYSDLILSSKGNAYGIGAGFFEKDVVIGTVAYNSPLYKALNGVDVTGKSITAVADLSGNITEITSYQHLKEVFAEYQEGVIFNLYIDGVPYQVSKQAFVESYVKYVDSERTLAFSSDYGAKPLKTETVGGDTTLPNDTAYIALKEFNGDAGEEFAIAMRYLQERGKSKLILDLRNNGGGYMTILSTVASYLTNGDGGRKNTIAFAKYKDGKSEVFKTEKNNYVALDKLTVIANENSASATECLMGALIYYGELSYDNLIVANFDYADGEQNVTYGKGIMQTTFPSKADTAIKLTTAYVFWPDGTTNIHGKGIQATIENSCAYQDAYALAKAKQ